MSSIAGMVDAEGQIADIAARHPGGGETFVFAPSLRWSAAMFQRPQQLARALARQGALVFYMQPRGTWPDQLIEIEEGLHLCHLPADAFRVLPGAYVYVVTWSIPQLAYFSNPRVMYDVIDHLDAFEGPPQRLRRNHARCLDEADLVTVTSARLYEEVGERREDALLCPNGVDVEHFGGLDQGPPPGDMAQILERGHPVVGYHGALARWFDYGLLEDLASRRPDYEFVLIGMDYDQTLRGEGILDRPNVHWLGHKPYRVLPDYVKAFDVGLIPFIENEITRATSPIKLYEYFAAGVPVVSAPLPEVVRYGEVLTASSGEAWLEEIDRALALGEDPDFVGRLRALGRENRWEARADAILARLEAGEGEPSRQVAVEKVGQGGALQRVVERIFNVWKFSGWRGLAKGVYQKLRSLTERMQSRRLIHIPRALRETYVPEDTSQVTLYRDQTDVFPDYRPAVSLNAVQREGEREVSLIATARDEAGSVDRWMESVLGGRMLPDEIVIVDAGSRDATVERLRSYERDCPVPLTILEAPGANIAQGRNLAVERAAHPLIAVTDFGCRPAADWLEKLTAPFRHDPDIEVVAGWSRAVDRWGRRKAYWGWQTLNDVHPQDFVPSSRSLAFTKDAWERVGGYPEWLTLTGEDTYFALELKRDCPGWAFVPSAVVNWLGADSWVGFLKKAYAWSAGNGELGYNTWLYRKAAGRLGLFLIAGILSGVSLWWGLTRRVPGWAGGYEALILAGAGMLAVLFLHYANQGIPPWRVPEALGLAAAQVGGFLAGARRKAAVDRRRLRQVKGLYFVLAGVPIDDTGGGARCAQIARELLRQGYAVVYIHRFPRYESVDPGVRIAHPNLFTYRWGDFKWDAFAADYGFLLEEVDLRALVEMPLADFLPLIARIRAQGGMVVYDLIDDWRTGLGWDWYAEAVEGEIIRRSQGLVASAPSLVERLEEASGRSVLYLPNAVNRRLFNPDRLYERPPDLPEAAWTAMYIGALWGDWFDWGLLREICLAHEDAAVVVIGDYRGQVQDPPPNLHFLGLKAQSSLPAYLAHAEVALIPWQVTPVTRATSPLKVYEYLAMEVPVVAPDLAPLRGLPGVWLAGSRQSFIELIREAREADFPVAEVEGFIWKNCWQRRIEDLLTYVGGVEG